MRFALANASTSDTAWAERGKMTASGRWVAYHLSPEWAARTDASNENSSGLNWRCNGRHNSDDFIRSRLPLDPSQSVFERQQLDPQVLEPKSHRLRASNHPSRAPHPDS